MPADGTPPANTGEYRQGEDNVKELDIREDLSVWRGGFQWRLPGHIAKFVKTETGMCRSL